MSMMTMDPLGLAIMRKGGALILLHSGSANGQPRVMWLGRTPTFWWSSVVLTPRRKQQKGTS